MQLPLDTLPLFAAERYPDVPAASYDTTSIEAADYAAGWAPNLRNKVLRLLYEQPLTVHEAATRAEVSIAAIQPRFSELRKQGQILPNGEKRVNEASGKRAMVWEINRG